ncbi:MAG: hypothetical protein KGL39_46590 [Patescibacteria group bacterium]|nr:hypothetical protein [Patescibacteria group bacterium]
MEEIVALETEAKFDLTNRSLWWAHQCGEIIRRHLGSDITKLLPRLAVDTGVGERTLWRRIELYDKYPDLEKELEKHGKDISMSKLLGTSKKEEKKDECICPTCGTGHHSRKMASV